MYDNESVIELRCLAGADGVASVAGAVINSQNYDHLERLLTAVQEKEIRPFNSESCHKLLQMLLQQSAANELGSRRIGIVNQILVGLSTSEEPVWDSVLSATQMFGWESLKQSISSLLSSDERKKVIELNGRGWPKSKMTLAVFLHRVEFVLKLRQSNTKGGQLSESMSAFVQNCHTGCITDLNSNTDNKDVPSNDIIELAGKIELLVSQYGWQEMADVVKHSLTCLNRNASMEFNDSLLIQGELIIKLHATNSCNITRDSVVDFADKFGTTRMHLLQQA